MGAVEAIMFGFLLFLVIMVYLLARRRALRFLLQVALALVGAYLVNLAGWSELFAFMGIGMTLSLIYYIGS